MDSPPVRRKRHIKRARFFDDSETEDEANFPLPAAPEVQINRIRKCTSRAGNYSQPLAREDAETMNCEYLKTLGMYQQSRELLSTTGQRRRRDYELYQQSRELLSTTGQIRRRDYELYQQSRELLSTTGQRRRRDYELYQQSRELLSTTGQRRRRDYELYQQSRELLSTTGQRGRRDYKFMLRVIVHLHCEAPSSEF
ncbi:unnamed protein product [Leuciscus chuanchicus]